MTTTPHTDETEVGTSGSRSTFYEELGRKNLTALWTRPEILTKEPETAVVPFLWPWSETRPALRHAGELVGAEEAERRVLLLSNPGLAPRPGTSQTLVAGFQLVMPGEVAITHRHTPAAMRFIVEGSGGFTTVNGERTTMEPGDFITTPNWSWHDHANETEEPNIWLDGLDVPLALAMNQIFFEEFHRDAQDVVKPIGDSLLRYGSNVLPVDDSFREMYSPLLNYKWERTREILAGLASDDGSPYDGVRVQYVNPRTGGPALPTIGAYAQILRPGESTMTHRHTSSTIYLVKEGRGHTMVGDQRLDWQPNDVFVVPTWATHSHANGSSTDDAVLLSFDDRPMLISLGWFREHAEG
jgi:gentisate 1,2-dioxygenase